MAARAMIRFKQSSICAAKTAGRDTAASGQEERPEDL